VPGNTKQTEQLREQLSVVVCYVSNLYSIWVQSNCSVVGKRIVAWAAIKKQRQSTISQSKAAYRQTSSYVSNLLSVLRQCRSKSGNVGYRGSRQARVKGQRMLLSSISLHSGLELKSTEMMSRWFGVCGIRMQHSGTGQPGGRGMDRS
jgi:hypothetical protein